MSVTVPWTRLRSAGAKLATAFRIADDIECGTVLNRLAGVHELRLAENFATCSLGCCLKADERCVADCGQHRGMDGHDQAFLSVSD